MNLQVQHSFANQPTGTLYLVPTPIGNLDDMTFRAVKVLREVDLIAAEDTRNTQKLLNHFEIDTREISFHEHNTMERIPELVQKLQAGMNIAQASDAGMPSISDPGHELVVACIKENIPVVPLPGANAGLTGLIASGLSPQPFYFYGFLNRKPSDQIAELEAINQHQETIILYEAPHRLKKTLKNMNKVLGSNRQTVLCREITKRYEDFHRGNLAELLDWAENNRVMGEFVIIVAGNQNASTVNSTADDELLKLSMPEQVEHFINQGDKPNSAIKRVAKLHQIKKQEVYNLYHHIEREG
ncbi:16S rRNA (cytidine(1402)-2'-O)-methyltransferase [Nicoliella spurrieriana]|uniref:Ribosomal RNA small subunit methyltransferase I n=1 Tax=Nicoliella spurrieriana TaxID=2925830 RepID=A0A976RTU1_9LACO|nr:16S rRNA (cytidine(1402)-2'-O)-methyltransferase [Nicoliella spurrieriana]UQS87474.1 16S rRNA (cytidine(1402)-2'-O)-methyltransferase [Nicoliella spurrieriana]